MMLLTEVLEMEVVPVKGKKGWFELTGKNIIFGDCSLVDERLSGIGDEGGKVIKNQKILGMHDVEDCAERDPRFENGDDEMFGVFKVNGVYTMVLNINLPEAVILSKLVPGSEL